MKTCRSALGLMTLLAACQWPMTSQLNNPYDKNSSSYKGITTVFASPGPTTLSLTDNATVTVKAWGAGGGGTASYGGDGGYSFSEFTGNAGDIVAIAVGLGGSPDGTPAANVPAPGGGSSSGGASGGGASVVALYHVGIFTLECCAGGGGGAPNTGGVSAGAGGGSSGQGGSTYGPTTLASNGIGGTSPGSNGSNMALTSSSFAGLGGDGATAAAFCGGGGGGYGGGAAPGYGGLYYEGAGGAGYATGTGAVTNASDYYFTPIANGSDSNYVSGVGVGAGNALGTTVGGNGLVVVTVAYK